MFRIKKCYLLSSKHTQTSLLDITFLGSVVVPIYAIKTSPIIFVKGSYMHCAMSNPKKEDFDIGLKIVASYISEGKRSGSIREKHLKWKH